MFKGKKQVAGKTEEEVYKKLGMKYIEPEMRQDSGEIEAALKNKLPKLISLKSIKGDLHLHTNWSDGNDTIEEMALASKKLGYNYIARGYLLDAFDQLGREYKQRGLATTTNHQSITLSVDFVFRLFGAN